MKEATEKALSFLEAGTDIGFVSDRGTPCISDPGALLVEKAHEKKYPLRYFDCLRSYNLFSNCLSIRSEST